MVHENKEELFLIINALHVKSSVACAIRQKVV